MRILNLEQFRALPEYTFFSKYAPCVFGPLEIKGDTWSVDFLCQDIASAVEYEDTGEFFDKLEASRVTGSSIAVDLDGWYRDGLFDKDQLFAVWEAEDIAKLVTCLDLCALNATLSGNERQEGDS